MAASGPPERRPGRGEPGTILVLEDDPAVCGLLCEVLEDCGYLARPAADRAQALRVARRQDRVDLLLADVTALAGSAGALLGQLRERHPGLRVLYMSGHRREEAVRRDPSTEGAPFLEKPFPLQLLGQTVKAALDGKPDRKE